MDFFYSLVAFILSFASIIYSKKMSASYASHVIITTWFSLSLVDEFSPFPPDAVEWYRIVLVVAFCSAWVDEAPLLMKVVIVSGTGVGLLIEGWPALFVISITTLTLVLLGHSPSRWTACQFFFYGAGLMLSRHLPFGACALIGILGKSYIWIQKKEVEADG